MTKSVEQCHCPAHFFKILYLGYEHIAEHEQKFIGFPVRSKLRKVKMNNVFVPIHWNFHLFLSDRLYSEICWFKFGGLIHHIWSLGIDTQNWSQFSSPSIRWPVITIHWSFIFVTGDMTNVRDTHSSFLRTRDSCAPNAMIGVIFFQFQFLGKVFHKIPQNVNSSYLLGAEVTVIVSFGIYRSMEKIVAIRSIALQLIQVQFEAFHSLRIVYSIVSYVFVFLFFQWHL